MALELIGVCIPRNLKPWPSLITGLNLYRMHWHDHITANVVFSYRGPCCHHAAIGQALARKTTSSSSKHWRGKYLYLLHLRFWWSLLWENFNHKASSTRTPRVNGTQKGRGRIHGRMPWTITFPKNTLLSRSEGPNYFFFFWSSCWRYFPYVCTVEICRRK